MLHDVVMLTSLFTVKVRMNLLNFDQAGFKQSNEFYQVPPVCSVLQQSSIIECIVENGANKSEGAYGL